MKISRKSKRWKQLARMAETARRLRFLAALAAFVPGILLANPKGGVVRKGTAVFTEKGPQMNIKVGNNTFIDWNSFNIAAGETTTFFQPSSHSVVWNRIGDANPSQIYGNLNANGFVVLMNQNGFYFGPNSVINVGGFLASSSPIMLPGSAGGGLWQFDGPPPSASIINYGQIIAGPKSAIYLVSEKIENHGTLMAPDGTLGLYAGKEVYISDRPDGRGISAKVKLPEGSVDNAGKLIADAGTISIHASVVNQNGLIQANSVREQNGVIELVANDAINVGSSSIISANGGNDKSDGGQVTLKSNGVYTDQAGAQIDIRGGTQGGNGGTVEISAPHMSHIESSINGQAQNGFTGGKLMIDPTDIFVTYWDPTTDPPQSPPDLPPGFSSDALELNTKNAFAGLSSITLQASHDIFIGTAWDLNASTGISTPGSMLTLEAGHDVRFSDGGKIIGGTGWSVQVTAGSDFSSPSGVIPGVGGIYLNGGPAVNGVYPRTGGAIQTLDGSIDLRAGNEIIIGSGYVRTDGGGSINVQALAGKVDSGSDVQAYEPTPRSGMAPSTLGVGGIGATAGGNVTINAGGDIVTGSSTIATYGAGNLTLNANGNISGNYVVVNGTGNFNANNVGVSTAPMSIGLVAGALNLNARNDIVLNEVYNPNGSKNPNRIRPPSGGVGPKYQFNYALDATLNLNAGHGVELVGSHLIVGSDQGNAARLPIYPPKMSIKAGSGGITLDSDILLYPSALGSLNVSTTGGGSLIGAGTSHEIFMSDSDSTDWHNFQDGHSKIPLHLANPDPVLFNISGNIENVRLQIPKETIVNVAGDTLNFFMTVQNLKPTDNSQLNVGGDIQNQLDRVSITTPGVPDLSIFAAGIVAQNLNLDAALSYDPFSHQLYFVGKMTPAQRDFLLHPSVLVMDPATGGVLLDQNGNPVTRPVNFLSSDLINNLYAESQLLPVFKSADSGLFIGGPGKLTITANKMDLGITQGVRSLLSVLNPNILRYFSTGADIDIKLRSDLDMTSSQIASFDGGSVNVNSAGRIDVGAQFQFTSDDTPRGIYSGNGGAVSVVADGDIVVNGSRIGTFGGGDVTVSSINGSVDAGLGAKGRFDIKRTTYDATSDTFQDVATSGFGSGIVAFTSKNSKATVGSVSVNAGEDIIANSGGILELAFNGREEGAKISLNAGRDILANGSGVLGVNVDLQAKGQITGLIVASQDINIGAGKDVSVTALGGGAVNVTSGGTASGTIVGGGNVSVSGDSITASVVSTGGTTSTSGDSSAAKVGAFQGVAAQTTEKTTQDADKTVADQTEQSLEGTGDDPKKKGGDKRPLLAKSTGRVTVILPTKQN